MGRSTMAGLALALTALLAAPASNARADIFFDNFEEEAPGGLNYDAFHNWTVSGGTVDVIPATDLGLPASHGFVVDLDGSTAQAGIMESNALTLAAGSYTLSFDLAGSQRGDVNIVDVFVGTSASGGAFGSNTYTLDSGDPFSTFSIPFTVGTSTADGRIFFHNRGGDNVGALLDNVSVTATAVPEPSALLSLSFGLAALGLAGRGRRRAIAA
jgi:hypothetical protein